MLVEALLSCYYKQKLVFPLVHFLPYSGLAKINILKTGTSYLSASSVISSLRQNLIPEQADT